MAETDQAPNDQPAPLSSNEQPAPSPQRAPKHHGGRKRKFDRDKLWQLAEQHPDWSDKQLLAGYPVEGKPPSLRWVQRRMQEYRDRLRQK
jgi:hypothetical protein